ncbi:metallophosphoesterase [Halorubrum californiense DSM 19288]|uniref:Metallophosphoesterase n=1 Tax=Halorubrum californiense DSM 19288 TaxID=1227465 RepID=M0DX28_9EURY|nr:MULTISPECIES: metallophosphoesterase [Halorubrum]ELZ40075.1 metallophosphoesterase [Halorubrum californiense DSM 19288]TKX73204.1 metallophosphoesterase [Halorubrum sp. GN11GM_10-3_MGM]
MRLLVCGDLHLKPAADDYDLDAVSPPEDVDAALVIGDLTHRAGDDDADLARRFVERLAPDVPVVYVPGNHDPDPMPAEVVAPVSGATAEHLSARTLGDLTVVGWGCERRSLTPPLPQTEFDALDPRTFPREDRRYVADRIADDLLDACHRVVSGSASVREAAASLGIADDEAAAFHRGVETMEATYERLSERLGGRSDALLATHVPPFGTSFDRHHAVGTRETDREHLHTGSIALALAIRDHDVFAAFSGHSHAFGYDAGEGGDGRPHLLNLGFRGVGVATVDPSRGEFAFTRR